MVLDGALDPSLSSLDLNLVQAKGFETAPLRAYVGHCVDAGLCFLGDLVDVLNTADPRAARLGRGQAATRRRPRLTVGNAVLGIRALYNEDYWSILDTALKAAFAATGRR